VFLFAQVSVNTIIVNIPSCYLALQSPVLPLPRACNLPTQPEWVAEDVDCGRFGE